MFSCIYKCVGVLHFVWAKPFEIFKADQGCSWSEPRFEPAVQRPWAPTGPLGPHGPIGPIGPYGPPMRPGLQISEENYEKSGPTRPYLIISQLTLRMYTNVLECYILCGQKSRDFTL